jgi:large subunit ribosomal protein L6
MAIPATLQVKVEENTRIVVSGFDKCSIGEFAASIRRWRPPEPYKGKGVRYANEIIRLKEGKAGKKK